MNDDLVEKVAKALGFTDDLQTDDASLNLQGVLDDLRGQFDPCDGGVCADTVERVINQLEAARKAIRELGGVR